MNRRVWGLFPVLLGVVFLTSCDGGSAPSGDSGSPGTDPIDRAIAVLTPTQGNDVSGTVDFVQAGEAVQVVVNVQGLKPNTVHGWHIHEFGDISTPDGNSMGGHYNPENQDHALPNKTNRHAGDLGNLTADAQGNARQEITVDNISINGTKNPILGRGVIIHADEDDGGQPTGNAGARIAQGVIGVRQVNQPES
ncbi:superoxide dismutase family protein [Lyngbya confervoides]|uniref:Superoxide dismutase family protein n=1 Tax=Lyngbya confervoides BDU141951 TaxID=1574623 RepID=A0ABD4T4D1_9CYAN|nr:superoxide dismutase family protein [Lyngbya confervoides]MCM1983333.1 superoxide dismutase family protein [Lyngbya confervoides BDU141951]